MRHRRRNGMAGAFTLTELIVVVAIIVLLMSLVMVAAKQALVQARVAGCFSNQRQIAFAYANYANDNNGAFVSPRTSASDFTGTLTNTCGSFPIVINNGNTNSDSYHSWTASYGANLIGNRERSTALTKGRLFPYMGDEKLYRSPLEPERDRLRSYSINGFVGVTVPTDAVGMVSGWHQWFCAKGVTPVMWRTTHLARIPQPSRTLCSLTEDDSEGFNYNNEGWVIDPRTPGDIAFLYDNNPVASTGWSGWIDWPALWDPKHLTYSYVDGSTESYALQKPALVSEIEGPPGAGFGHWYAEPNYNGFRRDWYHFRERLAPGIIPALPVKFTPGG